MWRDQPRLPPLIVRSVYDMEDVPVREAQALAGQAAVPRSIVVKQSSKKKKKKKQKIKALVTLLPSSFFCEQRFHMTVQDDSKYVWQNSDLLLWDKMDFIFHV